jgi:hypothetical protein
VRNGALAVKTMHACCTSDDGANVIARRSPRSPWAHLLASPLNAGSSNRYLSSSTSVIAAKFGADLALMMQTDHLRVALHAVKEILGHELYVIDVEPYAEAAQDVTRLSAESKSRHARARGFRT